MIDNQEMVFVVDVDNQPIAPALRNVAHANGLWHRTSGIWVINSKKQILCQKRSVWKDIKPGIWEAFFGGHLAPGEEYLQNAVKETAEELGLRVEARELIPYKIFKSDKPTHKEFQHIFALVVDKDAADFQFEKEEIDEVVWMDREEVREILLVKNDPQWVHKPYDEEVLAWIVGLGAQSK